VRLSLKPQKREFFQLFTNASTNIVEITQLLVDLLDTYPNDGRDTIAQIKEHEHEGDRLTAEVVGLVNRTFVTPFDRDDIFRLATSLDDICDLVDDAAQNLELYDVRRIPERAREQGNVIHRAARELDAGVRHLDGFRDASDELHGLRELEDEGDRILRLAVAELFRSGQDPLSIIRWKDIHEQLEEAVDGFQTAADVLEAILVKNR
jgi:predicted phosphate transport protein (TIGR00153 family)